DDGVSREQLQRTISQAIMRAYWERDEDISDRDVLASVANGAGFDGSALREIADAPPARDALAALTENAVARGVFGLPTFFVGDEMFWGKDRLDFVERLLKRPE
ncbi:MAG TPA: DsbA family protein, partial [Candidatus Limnocylindrales bacterium]|nr:DsbA family protein [Candidatus Limnocylindrales bacterium]